MDGSRGRSPFPPNSYLSRFTPFRLTVPNLAAFQLFKPAFCRRTDKARSVVCIFGLGRESIACKGNKGTGDRKEDEKNARVCRRPFCRAVIGHPKGPTSQTGQGIFTRGCFEIKVPYSPVSLMGSRLNYPSKPLEQNIFGALASNPEGLPVGRRELFHSSWRSVITGSWLSLPRSSQWPGGRGEQVKLYLSPLVGHLLQLSRAILC